MTRLDHAQLLKELSSYIDGEAAAELAAEIERHAAECEDCRIVVDTLRRTIRLYRQLPSPGLPEAARKQLYRSLDLSEH
jgi:anti-sigma factor RsiW